MKKFLAFLVAVISAIAACALISACSDNGNGNGEGEGSIAGTYKFDGAILDSGATLTLEDIGSIEDEVILIVNKDGTGFYIEIGKTPIPYTWTMEGDALTALMGGVVEVNSKVDGDIIYAYDQSVGSFTATAIMKKVNTNYTVAGVSGTYNLYATENFFGRVVSVDNFSDVTADDVVVVLKADGTGTVKASTPAVDFGEEPLSLTWTLNGNIVTATIDGLGELVCPIYGDTMHVDFDGTLSVLKKA